VAKNVFRAGEVQILNNRVNIPGPEPLESREEVEEVEEIEEYTGPTADQLRREAEEFKQNWESERQQMMEDAQSEAQRIITDAENTAFEEVKKKNEQAQATRQEAEAEAEKVLNEAREEAERIVGEAEAKAQSIEQDAFDRGIKQGEEKGYESGQAEVERLTDRLHAIINRAIERRKEIIEESEAQLIDLVLQIAKKVVKVISENQKNVVVNNVIQALRKLKSRADVVIRVNLQDLKMTSDHTKDIIRLVERVGNVSVAEDSTVDPGGCIIETDFGQIDARISSQLREIEERIVEISPIRSKARVKGE